MHIKINITTSLVLFALLLASCQYRSNESARSTKTRDSLAQKILGTWEYQAGNNPPDTTTTQYREDGTYTMSIVFHKRPSQKHEISGEWKIIGSNLSRNSDRYIFWNKGEATEGSGKEDWKSRKIIHISETELVTQFNDEVTVSEFRVTNKMPNQKLEPTR